MKTWYQKYNEQVAQERVKAYRNDYDAMLRSLERKSNPRPHNQFKEEIKLNEAYRYAMENFD